jgi:hypothetical protein
MTECEEGITKRNWNWGTYILADRKYRLKFDKRQYIQIAKDLRYSEKVLKRLESADDEDSCERIMHDARKGVI